MRLRPLLDKLVVKRDEQPSVTTGGIVIPDNFNEKADSGTVLSVGPGRRDDDGYHVPINIKEGDKVIFGATAGQKVEVDKEEFLILQENQIIGVIKI
jgi:chaperonin GroES